MSVTVVRRVRLPADRRTPAAARAVVRAVLAEAELTELVEEALLLTTELSTNGVVHAGTDIELEVIAGPEGVIVTVTDFDESPVIVGTVGGPEIRERGRGLFLVDHFAASWGTTHEGPGKGVWFRLRRPEMPEMLSPVADVAAPAPEMTIDRVPSPGALAALVGVEAPADGGVDALAVRLLGRLCGAVGAVGGVIRLDQADGRGVRPIAEYGLPVTDGPGNLSCSLAVSWPWQGDIVLSMPGVSLPYARPLSALTAERLGLALENDRLRRTDLRRQAWLTFLAEAGELLAQSLDVDLTMALIPRLVVPRLGPWSAVYSADDWSDPSLAAATHADESELPGLLSALSTAGSDTPLAAMRDAIQTMTPVPLRGGVVDGTALPLIARGQRLGVLAIGRSKGRHPHIEEAAIAGDLARRAALAIDNARIHADRRRTAQTLQQSLLPPALPTVEGISFGAEYVPLIGDADVGGDFYDVVAMPDGRWLVVIGDVSGKGVHAATVTGLVRDVIRILVRDGRTMAEILTRVNETLVERALGRYCTLAMAAVGKPVDGRLDCSLHLAGHDRPVLVQANGMASFVGTPGTALGLLSQVKTPKLTVPLAPGDTLVFYTDGVTERRRGTELFGIDRLRTAAGSLAGYPAGVIAARLRATTMAFSTEPPRDDIAILTLRNESPA